MEEVIEVGIVCLKLEFILLCVFVCVCVFVCEGECVLAHESTGVLIQCLLL